MASQKVRNAYDAWLSAELKGYTPPSWTNAQTLGISEQERVRARYLAEFERWETNGWDPKAASEAIGDLARMFPAQTIGMTVALAQNGIGPDTPGVVPLMTMDAEELTKQLTSGAIAPGGSIAGISAAAQADEGFSVGDAINDLWGFTKGVTRNLFTGARAIPQAAQFAAGGMWDAAVNEGNWAEAALMYAGVNPVFAGVGEAAGLYDKAGRANPWEGTDFGQSVLAYAEAVPEEGIVGALGAGQGSGIFGVDTEEGVGKRQRELAYDNARVVFGNGEQEAWTLGRGIFSINAESGEGWLYRNGSGVVDAIVSILTDPTLVGGKAITSARAAAQIAKQAELANAVKAGTGQLADEAIENADDAIKDAIQAARDRNLSTPEEADQIIKKLAGDLAKQQGISEKRAEKVAALLLKRDEMARDIEDGTGLWDAAADLQSRMDGINVTAPQGYNDAVDALARIAAEEQAARAARDATVGAAGRGRLKVDDDAVETIQRLDSEFGGYRIGNVYGFLSDQVAQMGQRWSGGLVVGISDDTPEWAHGLDYKYPAILPEGEGAMTMKGSLLNGDDLADEQTARTITERLRELGRSSDERLPDLEARRAPGSIPDAERVNVPDAPLFPRRPTDGAYTTADGYTVSRYGKSGWASYDPDGTLIATHRTLADGKRHASEFRQHLAWRAERGPDVEPLPPMADEALAGLEELVSNPGWSYRDLFAYAADFGLTPHLARVLDDLDVAGITNLAAFPDAGGASRAVTWLTGADQSATVWDESARAALNRRVRASANETLATLRAERAGAKQTVDSWEATLADRTTMLDTYAGELDDLIARAEKADALLPTLAKREEAIEDALAKQDITAAKIAELEAELDALREVRPALEFEFGLRTDLVSGAKTVDQAKFAEAMWGSRKGKALLGALAAIDDPAKIMSIFRDKIPAEYAQRLAAAQTADDIGWEVASEVGLRFRDDISKYANVYEAINEAGFDDIGRVMKMRAATSAAVPQNIKRLTAYMNTIVPDARILNLDDPQQTAIEMRNWLRYTMGPSAGRMAPIREVVDEDTGEAVIRAITDEGDAVLSAKEVDDLVFRVHSARNSYERGMAVLDIVKASGEALVGGPAFRTLPQALRDDLAREAEDFFRQVNSLHNDQMTFFHQKLDDVAGNREGEFLFADGTVRKIGSPVTDAEMIGSSLGLPSVNLLAKKIDVFSRAAAKVGADPMGKFGSAREFVDWLFSDFWRTAILVRGAYIVRNVAEMSVRMALVGRGVFTHPMAFTATALATRERTGALSALERSIFRYNKRLNLTADGTDMTVPRELDDVLDGAARKHQDIVNSATSTGDHRMMARHSRRYDLRSATVSDPKFRYAQAEQLLIASDSLVHNLVAGKGPATAERWIRAHMKQTGMGRDDALVDWFQTSTEGRKWIATVLEPSAPRTAEAYLDPVAIRQVLFDAPNSVRAYQRLLTNDFDADLVALLHHGGKRVLTNRKGQPLTTKDISRGDFLGHDERLYAVKRIIAGRELRPGIADEIDKMGGITYLVPEKAAFSSGGGTGGLTRIVDSFFRLSANLERQMAMGPEFRYAYWDKIADFYPMLDDAAQKQVAKVARESVPKRHSIHDRISETTGPGEFTLKDIEEIASNHAGQHVKDLFYRAMDKKAGWHAARLAVPFGQAWWNTMAKWTALTAENPVNAYLAGKAMNASLQDQVGGAIYSLPGYSREDWGREQGGFFFPDEGSGTDSMVFKYPAVFSSLGGLLAAPQNGAEYTGRMSSLNFAFGSENPLPGLGPALTIPVNRLVGSEPGEVRDIIRGWSAPFGVDNSAAGFINQFLPTYARAFVGAAFGEEENLRQHQLGAFISVANDPRFGDKIGSPTYAAEIAGEAKKQSQVAALMRGLAAFFYVASPSERHMIETPDGESVATRRAVDEFQNWVASGDIPAEYAPVAFIADDYSKIESAFGRDEAVEAFGAKYGYDNILALMSATSAQSKSMTGPGWDYWEAAPDSVRSIGYEAIPVLFPGDISMDGNRYLTTLGARQRMSWKEQADAAAKLVYDLQLRRVEQRALELGWSTDQLAGVKDQVRAMNGGTPVESFDPGRAEREMLGVRRALADPEFQRQPHYQEVALLMARYDAYVSDYQRATNDGRATLRGKGAANWRSQFEAEVRQIVTASQARAAQDGSGLTAQGVAEMLLQDVEAD